MSTYVQGILFVSAKCCVLYIKCRAQATIRISEYSWMNYIATQSYNNVLSNQDCIGTYTHL